MKFLKTKYYPVDIDLKIIINKPYDTERDFLKDYHSGRFIDIKGQRLNKYKCYQSFKIKENSK